MKKFYFFVLLVTCPYVITAYAQVGASASSVFLNEEVEDAVGGKIKEKKVEEGSTIVRYFTKNGKPFQEALIVCIDSVGNGGYDQDLKIAKTIHTYKTDLPGMGDKAFWEETGSFGAMHVVKGNNYIAIKITQIDISYSFYSASYQLMTVALKRLAKKT